jgi:hypothetical protein
MDKNNNYGYKVCHLMGEKEEKLEMCSKNSNEQLLLLNNGLSTKKQWVVRLPSFISST